MTSLNLPPLLIEFAIGNGIIRLGKLQSTKNPQNREFRKNQNRVIYTYEFGKLHKTAFIHTSLVNCIKIEKGNK